MTTLAFVLTFVALDPTVTPLTTTPLAARDEDPAVDQAWLTPTALTQPAGTVTVEDHELGFVGGSVALADRLQLTALAIPPVANHEWLAGVTAKVRALDVARFHLALLAGAGANDGLRFGGLDAAERFLSGGVATSVCFDSTCRGLVTAYVLANATHESSVAGQQDFARFIYGASGVVAFTPHVKLVTELMIVGEKHASDPSRSGTYKLATLVVGVRMSSGRLSGLLGVLVGYSAAESWISTEAHAETFVGPAFSLGYRFGGS